MRRQGRVVLTAIGIAIIAASPAGAQEERAYVGGLFGVSTLSGDGRAVTTMEAALASLYKPENGPALNLLAGVHLGPFFTVQGNYVFNRNDVTLFSSVTSQMAGSFYEQPRTSSQHAVVADALVYFRRLGSGIRPYLGTGLAVVRFTSDMSSPALVNGISPPAGSFSATRVALRSHVGIDFAAGRKWRIRYSFSETIGRNPISPHLMPPGERGLANFQNLFGVLRHF